MGLACLGWVWLAGCAGPEPEPPKPAPLSITTEVVSAAPFQGAVDMLGKLIPASRLDIKPPAAGRIAYASRVSGGTGLKNGQAVGKNDLLFRIESPAARLKLSEAELAKQAAETALKRVKKGVEGGILPTADLDARRIEAELAGKRLENAVQEQARLSFRAPISGILTVENPIVEGSEVTPDQVVARLAGGGARRVEAWAPAGILSRLQVGQGARLSLPRDESPAGTGSVVEVSREVEAGGVAQVVIEVVEDLRLPNLGEGVNVKVLMAEKAEAITVQDRSLVINGHVQRVFVLETSGAALRAVSRLVQTGSRSGGRVEITDGLRPGERVAVTGTEYLTDGQLVEDVTERVGGP